MTKRYSLGDRLNDMQAMEYALELSELGLGQVSPNPPVGCVVLDNRNQLISCGYHKKFGGAHAEIEALHQIVDKDKISGSRWFVTLEPCSHVGKTPSCAQTLARLPIASLTYGCLDPNPLVSGKGLEVLKAAGISVYPSELERECQANIEIFKYNILEKRTYLSVKLASSWDGQIGLKDGESRWITNSAARQHVHALRAKHDALLVGSRTIEIDNPRLDVRIEGAEPSLNQVVVLDPTGKLADRIEEFEICKIRPLEKVFLVTGPDVVVNNESVCHIELPVENGFFGWADLQTTLFEHSVFSCFVEGGALTLSKIISWGHYQKLHIYYGNSIIGAQNGLCWSEGIQSSSLKDAVKLEDIQYTVFGDNLLVSGAPMVGPSS